MLSSANKIQQITFNMSLMLIKMTLNVSLTILCLVIAIGMQTTKASTLVTSVNAASRLVEVDKNVANSRETPANIATSRQVTRRINPLRALLTRSRVSPLYLINGTVCRFINLQPVCTTLSTSGLSVGDSAGGGASSSSGGGGGGSSGGSSGGGGGSGSSRPSGSSSAEGGNTGSRPASSGVSSGGSSVQFANQPARASAAMMQDEQPDAFVERIPGNTNINGPQSSELQAANRPVGMMVARRPFRLLPFRRPIQLQALTKARQAVTTNVGSPKTEIKQQV